MLSPEGLVILAQTRDCLCASIRLISYEGKVKQFQRV